MSNFLDDLEHFWTLNMCEQDTEHYAGLPGMFLWAVLQLQ